VDRTPDPEEVALGAGGVQGNGESVTILYTTLQKLAFNHALNLKVRRFSQPFLAQLSIGFL
jgi:hypothetical protein